RPGPMESHALRVASDRQLRPLLGAEVVLPLVEAALVVEHQAQEGDAEADAHRDHQDDQGDHQGRRPEQLPGFPVHVVPALIAQAIADRGQAEADQGPGGDDRSAECSHTWSSGSKFKEHGRRLRARPSPPDVGYWPNIRRQPPNTSSTPASMIKM